MAAIVVAVAGLLIAVVLVGRGEQSASAARFASTSLPPAPKPLPMESKTLASRLAAASAQLARGAVAWRDDRGRGAGEPPRHFADWARYRQRAIVSIAHGSRPLDPTVSRLQHEVAAETRRLVASLRDLFRLSAGAPPENLRVRRPAALPDLLRDYQEGERRYGVGRYVLAAVNMVETSFGRVVNTSSAGATGPMQFEPPTWREYGRGGDIDDPHDAILGAANYLSASGAPGSYEKALRAYDRSPLYASAVLGLADSMSRDRNLVYSLYWWRP